jgi:hypothetical protein
VTTNDEILSVFQLRIQTHSAKVDYKAKECMYYVVMRVRCIVRLDIDRVYMKHLKERRLGTTVHHPKLDCTRETVMVRHDGLYALRLVVMSGTERMWLGREVLQ